jgi:hypothetical protein
MRSPRRGPRFRSFLPPDVPAAGYCATNGAVINVGWPFDNLAGNYLALHT